MTIIERRRREHDDDDRSCTGTAIRVDLPDRSVTLAAHWLLACSTEPFDLDPSSRQRLFDPAGVDSQLSIVGQDTHGGVLHVEFSDGRTRRFDLAMLVRQARSADSEAPPDAVPWTMLDEIPTIEWPNIAANHTAELRRVLGGFHRHGCFAVSGAPTEPGSILDIAERFGRISATNFGVLFDVESLPRPVDLAYSAVALEAHTDQPYRYPTPGLQFLHTLCNDAPGGESTVTDGLAAVEGLRQADAEGYAALCDLDVEFRYDIGTDVVVHRSPVIELDRHGVLRQLRFSPRLDMPPLAEPEVLTAWFRARRSLSEWFADPAHHLEFKMAAGDVLVVDNHRVLHGRRPFDASGGRRHLQGCYIDHDGPDSMWRLLTRRLGENGVIT